MIPSLVTIVAVYCCAELLTTLLPAGNRWAYAARVAIAVAAIFTIVIYASHAKTKADAEEQAREAQEQAREARRAWLREIDRRAIHPE